MLLEDTPVSVLGKSSKVPEPNAETDNLECSTPPGTHPPQAQHIYSRTGISTQSSSKQTFKTVLDIEP